MILLIIKRIAKIMGFAVCHQLPCRNYNSLNSGHELNLCVSVISQMISDNRLIAIAGDLLLVVHCG